MTRCALRRGIGKGKRMRTVVIVTTTVLVEVADGVQLDRDTLLLAADTANRRNEAKAENIVASVISRDSRVLAEEKTGTGK